MFGKKEMPELYTSWGEDIKRESLLHMDDPSYKVLCEYPRPQMVRDNYEILNGWWNYAFRPEKCEDPLGIEDWDGKILVPFSPESLLSGVNRVLQPNERLWYEREFDVKLQEGKRLLLHFGAVDQVCEVFLNGVKVGEHEGGYLPFTIDTKNTLKEHNVLRLKVRDMTDKCELSRGKQMLSHKGMFYTPQSGIWQTVWSEWVPDTYIENVVIIPRYDDRKVEFTINIAGNENREIFEEIAVPDDEFIPWTTENPHLYTRKITYGNDEVEVYYAMRCFTMERDKKGILRLCLNHKAIFMDGVLDQGYWPEGLMTPPSDEAFIYDIEQMKKTGFNMIRKHIKIEPMRWYYHCDRLGMIVWQDMVNGGGPYNALKVTYIPTVFTKLQTKIRDNRYMYFARTDRMAKKNWTIECKNTVLHLLSVPCIALWTPFNEGWGQFDALKITKMIRETDNTRLIDHASGWVDQGGGDVRSIHNYFDVFSLEGKKDDKRAIVYSEYGGFACLVKEHSAPRKIYGYRLYDSPRSLQKAYVKLKEDLFKLVPDGLCAGVFTQVSDIEDEINGVLTYDRKINKLLIETEEEPEDELLEETEGTENTAPDKTE